MLLPPIFRAPRARRARGAELIEFTLVLLPMLSMIFVLLDISWGVFTKATLQYAVRVGVRTGITVTGTQAKAANNSDLTTMVKNTVKDNSLGLLQDTSKIKVHYFQPPPLGSSADPTDVCNQASGNAPLNIMQVSVEGFSQSALVPRLFGWKTSADSSSTPISAVSADLIEPSRDVPPKGVAP
jgi:Flp pilus assembly protein TadG